MSRIFAQAARIIVLGMSIAAFGCLGAYAYTISSEELIERSRDIEGQAVVFKGELITSVLPRGDYAWMNLHDGDNAIGVWCRRDLLGGVKFAGDYKHKGDLIRVEGLFNRACAQHAGEMDIHADSVVITRQGRDVAERIDPKRSVAAIVLFIGVFFLVVRYRRRV